MKRKIDMNKQLKALSLAIGTVLALAGGSAMAEQTIGVQSGATAAKATAKVEVSVVVQKVVVLRVGNADATVSAVTFTVGPNPAITGAPGDSLPYSGVIPPVMAQTVATTNPTSALGALTVGAWTNAAGNATLSCSLGTLGSATAFGSAALTGGVPGTTDITVTSLAVGTNLQHPGTNLTACNGTTTTSIPKLTTMVGTFTYGTTYTAAQLLTLAAGTYGNTVTYTATTL